MKRIFIWGAGKELEVVYKAVNKELCMIAGIVDRDSQKQGRNFKDNIRIESPDVLKGAEFDYILISAIRYKAILNDCQAMGIDDNKVIIFWKDNEEFPYIDYKEKKIAELEAEVEKYKWRLENLPYELGMGRRIHIKSSEELLHVIIGRKASLCRFGDGEFELIRNRERPWFQTVNPKLALRLKEVLDSDDYNIIAAVADNFGSLEKYTPKAADSIRQYLYNGNREGILELLDKERVYYDAYVSRPYYIYKDKKYAEKIYSLWKTVWNERDVLIIEGKYSKIGINNDLLINANRIRRIICPEKNAFDYYEEILSTVKSLSVHDELVLISLGPTATVLAFDLAKEGIQALDVGQIDMEYEWFLHGAEDRIEIAGKGVAELSWCRIPFDKIGDEIYGQQIIRRIEDA